MSSFRTRVATLLAVAATVASACAPAAPAAPTAAPAKPTTAPAAAATSAPAAPAQPTAAAKPTTAAAPAATAGPTAAGAQPAGGLTKVRYGLPTAPPSITTVGAYFALDNGFFKEQGLDVEIVPYAGSTTAVRALLSRDADIVETGGDTAFLAQVNGAPIKIIGSPVAKGTDVVVATKDVPTLKDLPGKKWAISTPGDSSHEAAKILAQRNGVDPAKIDFVAVGGPADRARALIGGRVDASSMTILVLKPILDAIDSGDVKVVTSLAQEFPDLPLAYDITRDDVVNSQGAMLTKFLTAEIKGYRWAQDNPEKAATIAEKYIKEVDHDLMTRGMKGMADLGVYGLDGGITLDKIDRTQKLLVDLGTLKKTVKADEVATTKFVDEAMNTLGPVKQ